MRLDFVSITDRGIGYKERIVLRANAPTNLGFFVILASGLSGTGVNITPRATYWFPQIDVALGDEVVLYTGPGLNSPPSAFGGKTTHTFHWGQPSTLFNNPSDAAVVMELQGWQTVGSETSMMPLIAAALEKYSKTHP
jgi:hypothetical protein